MRLIATLAGIAVVVLALVALPAVAARRASRDLAWLLLGVYGVALALTGYALLAAGMCAASTADRCEASHGLRLAVPPGLIALGLLGALLVLASRRRA